MEKGQFATAFEKHRFTESVEVMVEWEDALQKLADISGFCFYLSNYKGEHSFASCLNSTLFVTYHMSQLHLLW